ncbi:TPA: hypothetical protein ACX6QP_002182 [Photobacterium damselae]
MKIKQQIENAKTLTDLCDALNSFEYSHDDELKLDEIVNLSDLPLFTHVENGVNGSEGAFSWDDTHVLTIDCNGEFIIVSHEEFLRD